MTSFVLVPIDGTRFSHAAIPPAVEVARRQGRRLALVHVRDPVTSAAEGPWAAELEIRSEEYLAANVERVRSEGLEDVTGHLLHGEVDRELLRWIDEHPVAVCAMTTHGRGPVTRAWLGSVADRVVRSAQVPILLVRPQADGASESAAPAPRPQRVVVPVDGSDASEAAIGAALGIWGGDRGSPTLSLVHVVGIGQELVAPYLIESLHHTSEAFEPLVTQGREYVDGLVTGLRARGVDASGLALAAPRFVSAIMEHVRDSGSDAIAMATHGRGGVGRLLLGSVADKVVRSATVPVLLTRMIDEP